MFLEQFKDGVFLCGIELQPLALDVVEKPFQQQIVAGGAAVCGRGAVERVARVHGGTVAVFASGDNPALARILCFSGDTGNLEA